MKNYHAVSEATIHSDEFSGVILSGVPTNYSFDTIDKRAQHFGWLRLASLPVLGICLGHQSMGRVFGALVLQHEEAEHELVDLKIASDRSDPIFDGIETELFEVMALHRGSITWPDEFKLLASSKKCKNQIMKHKTKPLYGFQFHPEQSSIGNLLLTNFAAICN